MRAKESSKVSGTMIPHACVLAAGLLVSAVLAAVTIGPVFLLHTFTLYRARRRHRALLQAMQARHQAERAATALLLVFHIQHPERENLREWIQAAKNTWDALLARQRAEIAALEK